MTVHLEDGRQSRYREDFRLKREHLCCAGTVNGMQSSLQNLLQALSYAAGLVLWRPEEFVWLMVGSVIAVALAAALYARYAMAVKRGR